MQKILIICGPTATGKTGLGIYLAKKFNGAIISADSRQVFRDMDIGTGKDLPRRCKVHKLKNLDLEFYKVQDIKIYGYDLVDPKDEFSVSEYLKFAGKAIAEISRNGKMPILVGGTGLYIKAVIDGVSTADVPKNEELREKLSQIGAAELFENLSQIDAVRAASLNSSDKKNPRRLIRAIEIAQYLIDHHLSAPVVAKGKAFDTLFIGLKASIPFLEKLVNNRVEARIKAGFEKEVKNLIAAGVDWSDQSMMSLGYRQWRGYFEDETDKKTAISEWKKEERK